MNVMIVLAACVFLLGGCAHHTDLAKNCPIAADGTVFRVIPSKACTSPGATTLRITASLKTSKPGVLLFGTKSHGTSDYRMSISIDGQKTVLGGNPQPENAGQTLFRRPEEGDGMRYTFETILEISPKTHRIIVALPDDGVAFEKEIRLERGKENLLRLEPEYHAVPTSQKPANYGGTSFLQGIRGLNPILNGKPI